MTPEIYIGDQKLDFEGEINLLYQTDNPEEPDQGSAQKSFTIPIPLTKKNQKILKHYDILEAYQQIEEAGRIEIGGNIICEGTVYLTEVTLTEATILIDGGDFFIDLKNTLLRGIQFPTHKMNITNIRNSWTTADSLYRYALINYGRTAKGGSGPSEVFVPQDFIPSWRVKDILEKVIYPYTIAGSFFNYDEGKDLYIHAPGPHAGEDWLGGKDTKFYVSLKTQNRDTVTGTGGQSKTLGVVQGLNAPANTVADGADLTGGGFYRIAPYDQAGTRRVTGKLTLRFSPQPGQPASVTTLTESLLSITIQRRMGGVGAPMENLWFKQWTDLLGTGAWVTPDNVMFTRELIFDAGYCHFDAGDFLYIGVTLGLTFSIDSGAGSTDFELYIMPNSDISWWQFEWEPGCLYPGNTKTIKAEDYLPNINAIELLKGLRHAARMKFFVDRYEKKLWIEKESDWIDKTESTEISLIDFSDPIKQSPVAKDYKKKWVVKYKDDTSDSDQEAEKLIDPTVNTFRKSLFLRSGYAEPGSQDFENPVFSHTENRYPMNLITFLLYPPRIWGKGTREDSTLRSVPRYRNGSFIPRLMIWKGMNTGTYNLITAETPSETGTTHTGYPEVEALNPNNMPGAVWENFRNEVDLGKTLEVTVKMGPHEILPFMMEIGDATKEGFRKQYKIKLKDQVAFYRIYRIVYDGELAKLSMVQIGTAEEDYGLIEGLSEIKFETEADLGFSGAMQAETLMEFTNESGLALKTQMAATVQINITPTADLSTEVPPATPTGLTVENDGSGGVNVSWDASSGATYYEYQYNLNGAGYGAYTNVGNTTSTYVGGFTNGDYLCIRVRACNGAGCSFVTFQVCVIIGTPD